MNNWKIFPNKIIDPYDCSDTIYSECVKNVSLSECIDLCKDKGDKYDLCDAGYYIEKGNDSLCIPLRTTFQSETNPIYNMSDNNISGVSTYTFINTNKYTFPPDEANTVFYYSLCMLQNNNLFLQGSTSNESEGVTSENDMSNIAHMNSVGNIIRLLPNEIGTASEKYKKIKYGDEIGIKLLESTLILRPRYDMYCEWQEVYARSLETLNDFKIQSGTKNKGEVVTYDEPFYLTYQDVNILTIDNDKYLKIVYGDYDKLIKEGYNFIFQCVPKSDAYYCDGSMCKSIPLNKTERKGTKARYKGSIVFNKDCYCNQKGRELGLQMNKRKEGWLIVITVCIIIEIILLLKN